MATGLIERKAVTAAVTRKELGAVLQVGTAMLPEGVEVRARVTQRLDEMWRAANRMGARFVIEVVE